MSLTATTKGGFRIDVSLVVIFALRPSLVPIHRPRYASIHFNYQSVALSKRPLFLHEDFTVTPFFTLVTGSTDDWHRRIIFYVQVDDNKSHFIADRKRLLTL